MSRLHPSPSQPNYLLLRALAAGLRAEVRNHLPQGGGARVLDIGCGARPYESLFAGRVRSYVGVDGRPGPGVDVIAQADAIPMDDASFDCVLSSQVVEHVPDPHAAVREMHRLLRPGGVLLLSTHGVARYHPNPEDYWRWTHAGLERLVAECGSWQHISVRANGGPAAAVTYLAGVEATVAAERAGLARPWALLMTAANVAAWRIDRALIARTGRMPGLSPNYLVSALRSSAER